MSSTVNYTVVVDALRMLCVGKIPALHDVLHPEDRYSITEQVMLQRNYHLSNPGFLHCFNILFNSKLTGQLYYGNSGKYRYADKDTCQITIENHVLYQSGWLKDIQTVLDSMGLLFNKHSYMEIAVDGLDLVGKHTKLTYNKQLGRKRAVKIHTTFDEKLKANVGYRIGSAQSEKIISIYNKSAELMVRNKQYISDFWHRNGLNEQNGDIHRCELRLQAKALKAFSGDFLHLDDPAYLASYFQTVAGSYLEFYNKNKTKKRHHLINWLKFNNIEISKQDLTKKAINKNSYKSMLRKLFEEYVITADEQYINTLASLAVRYNLFNWIRKTISRWIREFRLVN